jgi:hypothetical protein
MVRICIVLKNAGILTNFNLRGSAAKYVNGVSHAIHESYSSYDDAIQALNEAMSAEKVWVISYTNE